MPQIAQLAATYASQIFWLLVCFGLVFFVIGRGMLPGVVSTIDQRNKQIADDLGAAEAARPPPTPKNRPGALPKASSAPRRMT
jgi:F-type H+-transporting ATPase subunit b